MPEQAQTGQQAQRVLPQVKHIIAIASGKGGVGKSSVSANVAIALTKLGHKVGLLDCDIYGPSIHMMFDLLGQSPKQIPEEKMIVPMEQYGVTIMSMGLLSDDEKPVIWRGPMVHNVIQQFLRNVKWPPLDYLLIDMPPGTGDAQLSLTQESTLSGSVIVTTPQDVSLIDARKGLVMFQEVNVPVLGIVENMSYFVCDCGKRSDIFKTGGGQITADQLGLPFLGGVPLDPNVCLGGDGGKPVVEGDPDSPAAIALMDVAENIVVQAELLETAHGIMQPDLNLTWKGAPAGGPQMAPKPGGGGDGGGCGSGGCGGGDAGGGFEV